MKVIRVLISIVAIIAILVLMVMVIPSNTSQSEHYMSATIYEMTRVPWSVNFPETVTVRLNHETNNGYVGWKWVYDQCSHNVPSDYTADCGENCSSNYNEVSHTDCGWFGAYNLRLCRPKSTYVDEVVAECFRKYPRSESSESAYLPFVPTTKDGTKQTYTIRADANSKFNGAVFTYDSATEKATFTFANSQDGTFEGSKKGTKSVDPTVTNERECPAIKWRDQTTCSRINCTRTECEASDNDCKYLGPPAHNNITTVCKTGFARPDNRGYYNDTCTTDWTAPEEDQLNFYFHASNNPLLMTPLKKTNCQFSI